MAWKESRGKGGGGRGEDRGEGYIEMIGIDALGAYPQLKKHLLFIIKALIWSKATLYLCVCVCVCVSVCVRAWRLWSVGRD